MNYGDLLQIFVETFRPQQVPSGNLGAPGSQAKLNLRY
jgi:hypothetical protein